MRVPKSRLVAVPAVLVAAGSLLSASPAGAAPSASCPSGYELKSVAPLHAEGYRVPDQVDDPNSGVQSFGRPGNGDGFVCAVPLGNQTTPWGGQVYNFWDNTLADR
jgi:hypothetical protein